MSHQGLMKSLLYDGLKQNLKIVTIPFPKGWFFLYSRMSQLGNWVTQVTKNGQMHEASSIAGTYSDGRIDR